MTDETAALFTMLKALDLTGDQKALLIAILKVASHITEAPEEQDELEFRDEFEEAFAPFPPKTVELLLEYAAASPPSPTQPVREMVTRGMVTRGGTVPPIILRGGAHPGPASGHADDEDDD